MSAYKSSQNKRTDYTFEKVVIFHSPYYFRFDRQLRKKHLLLLLCFLLKCLQISNRLFFECGFVYFQYCGVWTVEKPLSLTHKWRLWFFTLCGEPYHWRAYLLYYFFFFLLKGLTVKKNAHHWTYITNNIVLIGEITENWFLCTYVLYV